VVGAISETQLIHFFEPWQGFAWLLQAFPEAKAPNGKSWRAVKSMAEALGTLPRKRRNRCMRPHPWPTQPSPPEQEGCSPRKPGWCSRNGNPRPGRFWSKAPRSTTRSFDHLEGPSAERLDHQGLSIPEVPHMKLTKGRCFFRAVGDAVDHAAAGTADPFTAVMIESDRILSLMNEGFVDHIKAFPGTTCPSKCLWPDSFRKPLFSNRLFGATRLRVS